jgi:hypothetical protein
VEKETAMAEQERQMHEREKLVTAHQTWVDEETVRLAELEKCVVARERQAAKREKIVPKQHTQVKEAELRVAERERQVVERETHVSKREARVGIDEKKIHDTTVDRRAELAMMLKAKKRRRNSTGCGRTCRLEKRN